MSTVEQEEFVSGAEETSPKDTILEPTSKLPEKVRILKEAFPDIDVEVIEAILQAQNNQLESSFESLLGISDPNYKSTPIHNIPVVVEEVTTTPPPRPADDPPFAYFQNQQPSVQEQLRMDEEFAKKLAMEDEQRRQQYQQKKREQQQQKQQQDDDSIFNLQEELPIIKEKMKEAGNAAKKKVIEFYNQLKANTRNNNNNNTSHYQHEGSSGGGDMPTTNAHYRGLPGDDGDDLLTGDISALHLSDYDVYAQTGGRKRETSTSDEQLKADEDFARQLVQQERRSSTIKKVVSPTVVIAPRSPLEFEGDDDYEDVGLTATPSPTKEETNSVPYVIGDDDDSDSDDLVDIDQDELFKEEQEEKEKNKQNEPVVVVVNKKKESIK